jgi:DNA primase
VATLGTATSETHLDRLYRMTPEVIFCFDGDEAGRKAAFRGLEAALPAMQDGRQARFLFLPEGEDPDTLIRSKGRDFFENLLDNAQPLEEFLFAHTAEGIDTDTTQGRTRWAKLTVPFLNRLPETGVYRDLMFRSLAERTDIEVSGLHRLAPVEPAPAEPSIPAESAPSYLASYSVPDAPTDYDDVPPPDYDQEPWPEDTDAPVLAPPNPLVYSPLNPVHRLIGLLVLRPTLASGLSPEQCPEGDRPDFALLKSLLEQIAAHSDISTAALLGYWYGTPEGEFLAELAGREILGENEELAELCQALWGKLQRENPLVNAKDRLSQLCKKDYASLGPDEKAELLKLTAEVRKLSGKA